MASANRHLVNELFNDAAIKAAVMQRVVVEFDLECAQLCRVSEGLTNVFRHINPTDVDKFKWSTCIDTLTTNAPTMLLVFNGIVSHSDRRNKSKSGSYHYPGICAAIAILLKERNIRMVGIQSIASLMLLSSHANKLVRTCTCTSTCNNIYSHSMENEQTYMYI